MGKKKLTGAVETLSLLKKRLSPQCAVRKSPFCEQIIAMRLKRVPCREIEQWLIGQGKDYRISYATVNRNLLTAGINPDLSFGEAKIEEWGGDPELDLSRELASLILAQKNRVDLLVNVENERNQNRRKGGAPYIDRRLAREMELFKAMLADHHRMERENKQGDKGIVDSRMIGVILTEDARTVLTEMLLHGEIKLDAGSDDADSPKFH